MAKDLSLIEQHQSRLYPAAYIPLIGFGRKVIMTKDRTGKRVHGTLLHVFTLSCECKVSKFSECGGVCPFCRAELESQCEKDGLQVSPEQLAWLATPCRKHFLTCSYPLCGIRGCLRHMALGPDGRVYCKEHFLALADAAKLQELEYQHGTVAARVYTFFRSLFW